METPPVIRELRATLTEARQPPGREPEATFSEVAGKLRKNDNVIRKFEKGEAGPRFDEIDDLVAAYAEATDLSPFDLWQEAIERARATGSTSRSRDEARAGRAARAAKAARIETQKAQLRTQRKQPSKAKKRRAG